MKNVSRFASLLAVGALLMSAEPARADGDPVNGRLVFNAHCNQCHNLAAKDPVKKAAGNPSELQNAIATVPEMNGRADLTALSLADITDISAYIATIYGAPAARNYQGLWWKSPGGSEDGWGINFAHQGEVIFGTWFTYDTTGKGWWMTLIADDTATAGTYVGKLYATTGPPFNAVPFVQVGGPPPPIGEATLTFADANNGTFHYDVNLPTGKVSQTKAITRQVLNAAALASCGTQANLAAATNFQDIWWAGTSASPGTESGWGINFAHQGDTVFASWFTYDFDGTPLWLVATAKKDAPGVYSGDLYRPSGPRFDAYDKSQFAANPSVGTVKLTFADGNNATFDYTVKLAGMAASITQTKSITRQIFTAPGTACK